MKVSTRDFQLNQKEYLDKINSGEKIMLTNHNNVVAYVTKEEVNEEQIRMIVRMVIEELGTIPSENKVVKISTPIIENPYPGKMVNSTMPIENETSTMPTKNVRGWCEAHFEKGVKYPLKRLTFVDENDNRIVDNKMVCPKCIEKFENHIKNSGGKINYG